jgi:hypothetical protein
MSYSFPEAKISLATYFVMAAEAATQASLRRMTTAGRLPTVAAAKYSVQLATCLGGRLRGHDDLF